ncbi:MAG: flagellar protein FlgN [Mycobacterium sp.]
MSAHADDRSANTRLSAMLVLLNRLVDLHDELRTTLSDKLDSMRRAELDGLHTCIERERALTQRIREQEGLRKQLVEQLGRGFGMSPDVARGLSARELAQRLAEPDRIRLNHVADRLKDAVDGVRRMNDLVGRVSAQVMQHVDRLFQAITTTEEPGGGYTKRGRTMTSTPQELFQAIG